MDIPISAITELGQFLNKVRDNHSTETKSLLFGTIFTATAHEIIDLDIPTKSKRKILDAFKKFESVYDDQCSKHFDKGK